MQDKIRITALSIMDIRDKIETQKKQLDNLKMILVALEKELTGIMQEYQSIQFNDVVVELRPSYAVELSIDPKDLPDEYRRIKTIIEPDKVALTKAIKDNGELIDGVNYVKRDNLYISWPKVGK